MWLLVLLFFSAISKAMPARAANSVVEEQGSLRSRYACRWSDGCHGNAVSDLLVVALKVSPADLMPSQTLHFSRHERLCKKCKKAASTFSSSSVNAFLALVHLFSTKPLWAACRTQHARQGTSHTFTKQSLVLLACSHLLTLLVCRMVVRPSL